MVFLRCLIVALAMTMAVARITSPKQKLDITNKKSSTQYIKVAFSCGAEACRGNELTPTQVKDKPRVSYQADKKSFYSLIFLGRIHGDEEILKPGDSDETLKRERALNDGKILTDPEDCAAVDNLYREYNQWLVVNIPGDQVTKGEEIAQYISSAPPKGSGFHRYTFLVYKQPGKLQFDEKRLNNTSVGGRDYFCINRWAAKYRLGDYIGGNYYYGQYDSYVPQVYKQIGAEYLNKEYVRPV